MAASSRTSWTPVPGTCPSSAPRCPTSSTSPRVRYDTAPSSRPAPSRSTAARGPCLEPGPGDRLVDGLGLGVLRRSVGGDLPQDRPGLALTYGREPRLKRAQGSAGGLAPGADRFFQSLAERV